MAEMLAKKGGIRLSTLNKSEELKSLSMAFGDEVLELSYSKSAYTPEFEKKLKELEKEELIGGLLGEFLFLLIRDWNVKDLENPEEEDPEKQRWYKVPLTKETFTSLLSIEALSELMKLITEDSRPN